MEIITILSIIEGVMSLTGKFRSLFAHHKLREKDEDGFFDKAGDLLDELRFAKDVDMRIEYFAGEDLEEWLSQLQECRNMDVLKSVWLKIEQGFDKHIVQGIENQLPRMKSIACKTSSVKRDEIPRTIINEVVNLAKVYPELIELMEEFIRTVRTQSDEIRQQNFKNTVQSAVTLDRQIKRIKIRANTLLRDLCSVVIFAYDEVTGVAK